MENKVVLLDYMGSDNSHALSAWASTFLDLGIEPPKDPKMRVDHIVEHILSNSKRLRDVKGLLDYLAREGHESPFRMSSFMIGMTTEIATHIQKLKHKVLLEAENGESARYKVLNENKFYLPQDWLEYGDVGKHYYDLLKNMSESSDYMYKSAHKDLIEAGMPKARAKESARFFKMYNSQINTVNKFSFAGIVEFHRKRGVSDAQKEVRDLSDMMIDVVRNIEGNPFKYSLEVYGF